MCHNLGDYTVDEFERLHELAEMWLEGLQPKPTKTMLKYLVIHVENPDGANIPLISHIKIDYAGQNCVEAHKVYNRLLSEKALDTQVFFGDPLAEVEYAQYERAVDLQG